MRLLFDESVPNRLRHSLLGHEVRTVVEMGWSGTKNGKLLALTATQFDALVTVDKNMQYQQNLSQLPVSVVVLRAKSNELTCLLPLAPELLEVLANLQPRVVVQVGA
jgi:predicted nuclease of predicted toxin-antitoxin system